MITADPTTLMRQAWMTADEYLLHAIECIDSKLGKGYAKAHPELIAAFMQTASIDMAGATIARSIQDGLNEIGNEIGQMGAHIDELSKAAESQATQLKYLGTGDAATTMGAIEALAVRLGEAIENISSRE